jgi:two-component system NtrC family response regulator
MNELGEGQLGELPRLLIVEDDDDMREQMQWALCSDYELAQAADQASAIERQQEFKAPLVTLDLGLPPHVDGASEGFAVLEALLRLDRNAKVIVITGKSDNETAVGAIERGAFDFLHKPVDLEELRVVLRRAHYLGRLEGKLTSSKPAARGFQGIFGGSASMQQVYATIQQVAGSSAPVLVLGESGTGKELAARAIHREGPRRDGPFVALNCAALPESLLESELFGHEKGAFTGAAQRRQGHLELAQEGTLFLDELGELPLSVQVKLLRFLQELVVVRVGGREEIKVDTRLIAATNVDLKGAIAAGKFREDLYYRLAIVTIQMPALRERPHDILPLAEAFLVRDLLAEGKVSKRFDADAKRALQSYAWPGNVRQLENHVRRAALMAEGQQVTVDDLKLPDAPQLQVAATTLRAAREAVERQLISETLLKHAGNVSRSAKELGVSRPTLHELLNKYKLRRT